jgi:excisionase family DNA binding protein
MINEKHNGPVGATETARILNLDSDPVPFGWKVAPLAAGGRTVVAFDQSRSEVTVVHGPAGTALAASLAASGYRWFGAVGEAEVYLRRREETLVSAPEPVTMSIEEAARFLGISRGLAYDLARRHELPVVRLGRRMVVPTARLRLMLAGAGPDGLVG